MKKMILAIVALTIGTALALSACNKAGTGSDTYPVTGKAGTLDWSLDKEGTLTVSGVGSIPDYAVPSVSRAENGMAPWVAHAAQIKAVIVESGVTGIGDNAFANLTELVTVTLPETLSSIGDGVFEGCDVLQEISIPPLPDGALEEFAGNYTAMADPWVAIDNDYSTLAARETLTSSAPVLSDFWRKAYLVINRANTVAVHMEFDGERSEQEKTNWKGRAELYKAKAYLYLTTLFGGVPLVRGGESPEELMAMSSSSVEEINDYVLGCIGQAIEILPRDEVAQAFFVRMLEASSRKDINSMAATIDQMASLGALGLTDINGDGLIGMSDMNGANLMAAQARLSAAEVFLTMGDVNRAAWYLNGLTEIAPSISPDQILSHVMNAWLLWNRGVKFVNLLRWGETASWGRSVLMPIPLRELDLMPNLTQNPGW